MEALTEAKNAFDADSNVNTAHTLESAASKLVYKIGYPFMDLLQMYMSDARYDGTSQEVQQQLQDILFDTKSLQKMVKQLERVNPNAMNNELDSDHRKVLGLFSKIMQGIESLV